MALRNTVVGSTLSQIGLATHLNRSTSWIRKQGELVTGKARHMAVSWQETWARMEYSNKRLAGYKRVA